LPGHCRGNLRDNETGFPATSRVGLPGMRATLCIFKKCGEEMAEEMKRLWSWVVPPLAGAVLAAGTMLGLVTASEAQDSQTYAAGMALAALTLLALGWGWRNYLDGRDSGLPVSVLVERTGALLLLIAALAALALGGLFLAAYGTGAAPDVGYGLFGASLAMIFLELKHYFDRRDRAG
jgi:hypothetical protein